MSKITFDTLFNDAEVDFECPGCNHVFPVNIVKSLEGNYEVKCPNCHNDIIVQVNEKTKQEIKEVNKEFDEMNKILKDY